MKFNTGTKVQWKWLGRIIIGVVEQVFEKPIAREIKGKKIKRNGSPENPAYLVKSETGNEALKLESELSAEISPAKSAKLKNNPKIFGG